MIEREQIKKSLEELEQQYWNRKIDAALAQSDPDPEDGKHKEAIKDAFREVAKTISNDR